MPVYRRRRYSRRRRYGRRRGGLSKSSLLMNRSSTSQALQISRLNRKLNRFARQNYAEVKSKITQPLTVEFRGSLLSDTTLQFLQPSPEIDGNQYHVRNYTMYLRFAYSVGKILEPGQIAGYNGASVRVLTLQTKSQMVLNQLTGLSLANILSFVGVSGEKYIGQVICPLKEGITSYYHVLFDKTYNLSDSKCIMTPRIRIVPKIKKLSYLASVDDVPVGGYAPIGTIFTFIISSGLTYSDTESIKVTYFDKLAYTDN